MLSASVLVMAGVVGSLQAFMTGVPKPWAVLPLTVVIPVFIIGVRALALLPLLLLVAVKIHPIALGHTRLRWWSWASVLAINALAWFGFVYSGSFAWKYHGELYVIVCGIALLAFTIAMFLVWRRNRQRPTFASVFAFHAIEAVWLASYAFPYLGELP